MLSTVTTLYKINNTNKISWWRITQEGCTYTIEWGQDHTLAQAKTNNRNHYTAVDEERAEFEVEQRIHEQEVRRGYSINIPNRAPDLPMLAQQFDDHTEKVRYGKRDDFSAFAIQPKLDGLRCLATHLDMTTRRNVKIKSCPHIEMLLEFLPEDVRLDGELFIKGCDLQTIQSYVRRNQPHPHSKLIEYHVFDCVDSDRTFLERIDVLKDAVYQMEQVHKAMVDDYFSIPEKLRPVHYITKDFPIKIVPTQIHNFAPCSEKGQHLLHQEFRKSIKDGFEGIMIRNVENLYAMDYRSPDLLKYKERVDDEFEIVDVSEGYNSTGVFVCKTEEGRMFEATPAWTNERKRRLLQNKEKYIGRMLTVEFETYSRDRIPLKPVGKCTREIG